MVRNLVEEPPSTARPQFIFNPFDDDNNCIGNASVTFSTRPSLPVSVSGNTLPNSHRVISLHCRSCMANPCRETTATTCGHVFCKRCITEKVASTSRCPACGEMTLLYMLFKMHLD
ncbi:hypothetical protein DFS33DRAFT_1367777 [Desarmillaria ectypa]|nr:hypothetical protein DFS33DRAFT_1367777 [Desarmillaria ectypa]